MEIKQLFINSIPSGKVTPPPTTQYTLLNKQAKRSISRRLIEEEVAWYETQTLKQMSIKMAILLLILSIAFLKGIVSVSMCVGFMIVIFFYLTINQKFYLNQYLNLWAKVSFFVTGWTLCHCALHSLTGANILLVSLSLNLMLTSIYLYHPSIKYQHLGRVGLELYELRLFMGGFSLMFLIGAGSTLSSTLILGYLIALTGGYFLLKGMITFGGWRILPYTKIINNTHAMITLLKLDPTLEENHELQRKCLQWIKKMTQKTSLQLKEMPYHSKFYETYWELFKDYAEQQLNLAHSSFVNFKLHLQHATLISKKNFKEDVFLGVKIIWNYLQLLYIGVGMLRELQVVVELMQIYEKEEGNLPMQMDSALNLLIVMEGNDSIPEMMKHKIIYYLKEIRSTLN